MKGMSIARWLIPFVGVWALLLFGQASAQAQACRYVLGFAAIHSQIPNIVGDCRSNEMYDALGNSNQLTTNGLMQWRKADNFTAFTDGYRTWVNGPCGIEERLNSQRFPWEANPDRLTIVGSRCGAAPPQPAVVPTPAPGAAVIQFWADQTDIRRGQCTEIHWNVQNIDSVYFDETGVTGQGHREVCPKKDETFVLDVRLRDGRMEQRRITINVDHAQGQPRVDFYADRESISRGSCTRIHWKTENIESVYFEGQGVTGNESREVCPTSNHTYRLDVHLHGGQVETHKVKVEVR
jgi:hypothetical protein